MNTIFFILIFLFSFILETFALPYSQSLPILPKLCCIPPKINIDPKRSNDGRIFFRHLTIPSDLYEEINPEKMCNLMHFLFQQASRNNQSIIFTEGIFILFDSSNQILNRLIKPKQTPERSPLRNTRYPTYGMDIPGACLPNRFDHIIFGELPTFLNDYKYNGQRIFIKPDRFGFEKMKISSVLNDVNSFIEQIAKQEFCRLIKGETKPECAKLRAFKENTDTILLKNWKNILANLPLKWKINKQYKERAIKYGIREIDQQSKDLVAAGAGRNVQEFRKFLIEQYGQDDIRVRKGREIILTITELKQSRLTCELSNDIKCRFS